MTVVGPLTSLIIGAVALLGHRLAAPEIIDSADPLRAFQERGPIATILLWLGAIDIMLGAST